MPPNVRFEIDDCEQPWTFALPFDFIHSRFMTGSIHDWPRLIRTAYDFTTPGGWVEFQDLDSRYGSDDGSLTPDHAIFKWLDGLNNAADQIQRPLGPGPSLEGWFRDAGFKNIVHKRYKMPVGPWPKDRNLVKNRSSSPSLSPFPSVWNALGNMES